MTPREIIKETIRNREMVVRSRSVFHLWRWVDGPNGVRKSAHPGVREWAREASDACWFKLIREVLDEVS